MVVNLLIVSSLVGASLAGAVVVLTATGSGPAISIGSVIGVFSNGTMVLHVPLEVHNGGPLPVSGVSVDLNITDSAGHRLIVGSSGKFDVKPNSVEKMNITLVADLREIPEEEMRSLLTQDQTLQLNATLRAAVIHFVGVSGKLSGILPWGALVKNLTIGGGSVSQLNQTYSEVSFPYSFLDNNQYFHVFADVTGTVTDGAGTVAGKVSPFTVSVRRGHVDNGTIVAIVKTSSLVGGAGSLHLNLDFQDENLFRVSMGVDVNA